jgi:ribokinase
MVSQPEGHAGRVTAFGSVNLDLVIRGASVPGDGETVLAKSAASGLGGKGANQAVAAVRAGAEVAFVGAVGAGPEGERLRGTLASAGVDITHVRVVEAMTSGMAIVLVSDDGENRIVVVPGANHCVGEADASAARDRILASDVLVVQGEVPASATRAALRVAREAGVRVLVNLAPAFDLGAELAWADPLVVNEVEAGQLIGERLFTVEDVLAAGPRFRALAPSVVVTVGAGGAVLVTGEDLVHIPAPLVAEVRDTTGAGDAAVGVLAAALARGLPIVDATTLAVAAGSLSVTVEGAAENYPDFSRELAGLCASEGTPS